jgi:hypothetical protein
MIFGRLNSGSFHPNSVLVFIRLQDLARLETGNEASFNEPFDLRKAIEDAVHIYQEEGSRRSIDCVSNESVSPTSVVGDSRNTRKVVQSLNTNARTSLVNCRLFLSSLCSTNRLAAKFTRTGRYLFPVVHLASPKGYESAARPRLRLLSLILDAVLERQTWKTFSNKSDHHNHG